MGTIDNFVSALTIGARANMFNVVVDNIDSKLDFLCKATSLPGKSIGIIEVPYLADTVKIAGDNQFEDWQITVLADEDFVIRQQIIDWMEEIKKSDDAAGQDDLTYFRTATVAHLNRDNTQNGNAMYKFYNMWPSSIDPVDLVFDSKDTIIEYGVTFSFSHWLPE